MGVGETTQVVFLGNYQSEYVEHRQRQHRRLSLTCGPCAVVRIPPTIRLPARPSWKHASSLFARSPARPIWSQTVTLPRERFSISLEPAHGFPVSTPSSPATISR